jgi:hypothetical protein
MPSFWLIRSDMYDLSGRGGRARETGGVTRVSNDDARKCGRRPGAAQLPLRQGWRQGQGLVDKHDVCRLQGSTVGLELVSLIEVAPGCRAVRGKARLVPVATMGPHERARYNGAGAGCACACAGPPKRPCGCASSRHSGRWATCEHAAALCAQEREPPMRCACLIGGQTLRAAGEAPDASHPCIQAPPRPWQWPRP